MTDELAIKVSLVEGAVVIRDIPGRYVDGWYIPRYEAVHYDGQGNVVKHEISGTGVRIRFS